MTGATNTSVYEVHEGLRGHPGVHLGLRHTCSEYFEALDFALDFLEEHDPERTGSVSALEIVKVTAHGRETAWRYDHDPRAGSRRDVSSIFGFDVTRPWSGPPLNPRRDNPPPRT